MAYKDLSTKYEVSTPNTLGVRANYNKIIVQGHKGQGHYIQTFAHT